MTSIENLSQLNLNKEIFKIVRENKKPKRTKKSKKLAIYKRHDKSLFELSRRFLKRHYSLKDYVINLEILTTELDIERRRLYDIINILECLGIIYRVSKNCFMWKGLKKARENISKFKNYFSPRQKCGKGRKEIIKEFIDAEYKHFNLKKKTNKRDKSLAILSLNLVYLFYESKTVQTLEETAQCLTNGESSKLKTRIRRLYDITNVFKSMGLIEKITTKERKIAIRWLGLEGFDKFMQEQEKEVQKLRAQNVNSSVFDLSLNNAKSGHFLRKRGFNEIDSTCLGESNGSVGSPVVDLEMIMVKNFMKIIGRDSVKKKLKINDSEIKTLHPNLTPFNDENIHPNIEEFKIVLPLETKKSKRCIYSEEKVFSIPQLVKKKTSMFTLTSAKIGDTIDKNSSCSAFNFINKK